MSNSIQTLRTRQSDSSPRRRLAQPVSAGPSDAHAFLHDYAAQFQRLCLEPEDWISRLIAVKDVLVSAARTGHKAILVGNGGSAAIASHVAVDLTKNAGIRAVTFNEPDLITCFANDYGYERWLEQAIDCYGDPGDVLIAISSSGRSPNILNACHAARRRGFASVITFSGFSPENPLRALGDHHFWVESSAYNLVETAHQFWLLALVDLIIGRTEYPAKPAEPRPQAGTHG